MMSEHLLQPVRGTVTTLNHTFQGHNRVKVHKLATENRVHPNSIANNHKIGRHTLLGLSISVKSM